MNVTASVREQKGTTPFFTIWTGQAISLITSELTQFALVWWLTETATSATAVALATLIALLPKALLSPLAGALVDRWNRRTVMIVADGAIALTVLALGGLFWLDRVRVEHVYLAMLIRALGAAFHTPAMFASTALMVPKAHLPRVAGLNQTLGGLIAVVAPPLGAWLLGPLQVQGIIALDVGGALLATLLLLLVPVPQPQVRAASDPGLRAVWHDLRAGLRYVRDWPGAVGMLILSTSINFLSRPAFSMTSLLVTRHFHGTQVHYGWLGAAFGAGIVSGGIALGIWGGFRRRMQTSLAGVLGMGLGITAVGLAPQNAFPLALGGIFAGGAMIPMCMAPIQALVQSEVDPAMQGRVFTILDSVSTAISPLSLALAGPLFDRFGPRAWYLCAGPAAVLIALKAFATPSILNLGAPDHPKPGSCT